MKYIPPWQLDRRALRPKQREHFSELCLAFDSNKRSNFREIPTLTEQKSQMEVRILYRTPTFPATTVDHRVVCSARSNR
jgi:hypothetical protein